MVCKVVCIPFTESIVMAYFFRSSSVNAGAVVCACATFMIVTKTTGAKILNNFIINSLLYVYVNSLIWNYIHFSRELQKKSGPAVEAGDKKRPPGKATSS